MKRFVLPLLTCFSSLVWAQDQEFHLDQVYEMDSDGTITLYSNDAQVMISGSSRSSARVKVDWELYTRGVVSGDKEFEVEVHTDDGNLVIRQREEGNLAVIGSVNEEYTIIIEAPRGSSLQIKGDDDDYMIRNIDGAIVIDNDDGDAVLESCGGDFFEFDFDDGNIVMDQGQGELLLKLDDGDFTLRNGRFDSIRASNDDGNLTIENSLQAGGNYSLEANDGDIEFTVSEGGGNFAIHHDDSRLRVSNHYQILEEDDQFTRLQLGNGSAEVKIRSDDAYIKLTAQ